MQLSRSRYLVVLAAFFGGCCCPEAPRRVAPTVRAKAPRPVPVVKKPIMAKDERRIRDVLAKKRLRGLNWEAQNLDQVVMYLRTVTGLNFYISPKVREEKFDDVSINAQLDDVSIETILSVILTEPFELRWDVRDGVVWIHTPEEFAGKTRLRYLHVKDLIGKTLNGEARDGGFATTEDLAIELQRRVLTEYWEQEGVTMEGRKGILIVRAARTAHEALERELASLRGKTAPRRKSDGKPPRSGPGSFTKTTAPTTVSLSVSDQPLGDVIKMLQIQTGLNLMIDPRIAADVKNTRITALKLENAPLASALKILAESAGDDCVWTRKGSIHVLTHKDFVKP